jgi:hypothetical protein
MNETVNILVLAANPKNTTPLRLDEEVREIDQGLRRSRTDKCYQLHQQWAVRPRDVRRSMLDASPSIVHFCGHGAGEEGLAFEDEVADMHLVPTFALAGLFELFADSVKCVLLNACYSEIQALSISEHIDYVIGMSRTIGDKAAIEFSVGFYDAIVAGKDFEIAYKFGCNAIQMAGIPEHLTPVLHRKQDAKETPHQILNGEERITLNSDRIANPRDYTAPISGYSLAVDEALSWMDSDVPKYSVRQIQTTEELEKLWKIDMEAYQDASITLDEFYSWWDKYEFGLKALFLGDKVIGAFGLWPLSSKMSRQFKEGEVCEGDLRPTELIETDSRKTRYWYVSGIVLRPEFRKPSKTNPIVTLLTIGLNIWMESGHLDFPVEVSAIAYSIQGKRLLERFGFIKIRDLCSDTNPYPLYCLKARSKHDLANILRKRGI